MDKLIADINEKLKRGILDMLVLQLLSEEDRYGYQLKAELNKRAHGHLVLTEGVLYPPLYRMIKKGYISEHKEIVCQKRVRVYYHLEEPGKQLLALWHEAYYSTIEGVEKIMKPQKPEQEA